MKEYIARDFKKEAEDKNFETIVVVNFRKERSG